ncbi:hypothetical protein [Halorarius litoreus]|uniref:hypothetical protein n=1 Tax=Halorarius litoreus TaxID=2962676 RepID=UPI0020CE2093|nr:hypothetical protein [Halorarius litoreus]
MPLLELKLREGRLDDAAIEELTTELTRAASEAEGTDLDRAKSLTWTLVDSFEDREWRVGGAPAEGPTYLLRAHLAEGLVDDAGKQRFVELADEAIQAVDPDYNPFAAWVIVNEVDDGNWAAGGSVLPSSQIADLTGAELVD